MKFLLFLCIGLLLCGCTAPKTPGLAGSVWQPTEKDTPESVFVEFTEDNRRVVGCCGTNRFFGPVEYAPGNRIRIGMLGATRMASPLNRYENIFLDNLQSAKSYSFDRYGNLIFRDIDGSVCLKLKRIQLPEAKKQ